MRTPSRLVTTSLFVAGLSLSGASAALAQQDCAYVPTTCEGPTELLPTTQDRAQVDARTEVNARTDVVSDTGADTGTLPFTGGDVALAALVGAGAVAGGAVLVVAARRRPAARV